MEPEEVDTIPVLARRAGGGDREALGLLILRLRAPLFALAYAELRHYDDAQDAVAAALLRICRSIGRLRDPARAMVWIRTVARNEARRLGRARGIRHAHEISFPNEDTSASLTADTLRLDIERALQMLPTEQARAATLFYLEGRAVADIARALDRPMGTIKYWLHVGRSRLAQEMKEYAPMSPESPRENEASPRVAALITASESAPVWADAIRRGGWDTVHIVSGFAEAASAIRACRESGTGPLCDTRFVVLDHRLGERSAFELYPLLRDVSTKGEEARIVTLLLLEVEGIAASEHEALILSAYVSGFDLCLTTPFAPETLASFARRALNG